MFVSNQNGNPVLLKSDNNYKALLQVQEKKTKNSGNFCTNQYSKNIIILQIYLISSNMIPLLNSSVIFSKIYLRYLITMKK